MAKMPKAKAAQPGVEPKRVHGVSSQVEETRTSPVLLAGSARPRTSDRREQSRSTSSNVPKSPRKCNGLRLRSPNRDVTRRLGKGMGGQGNEKHDPSSLTLWWCFRCRHSLHAWVSPCPQSLALPVTYEPGKGTGTFATAHTASPAQLAAGGTKRCEAELHLQNGGSLKIRRRDAARSMRSNALPNGSYERSRADE